MLKDSLKALFTRDLNKLKLEISSYQNESAIWLIDKAVLNSAGNLCLHLVGNLNTFIGAELGNTGYVRDRPLEFSLKDVPRAELISNIDATIKVVNDAIDSLSAEDMNAEYPQVKVVEGGSTIGFILIHLSTHLAYHLGQINYHRRLLDI